MCSGIRWQDADFSALCTASLGWQEDNVRHSSLFQGSLNGGSSVMRSKGRAVVLSGGNQNGSIWTSPSMVNYKALICLSVVPQRRKKTHGGQGKEGKGEG